MIRLAVFLILTATAAILAVWFAERPGEVAITWLGYHVETSFAVLVAVATAVGSGAVVLWSLLRGLVRSPQFIAKELGRRRAERGQLAITRGLMAVGAGDAGAARRFAAEALRFAANQPLLLLLRAQAAQLSGERERAEAAFQSMVHQSETKLVGLHGLFLEARRRNDAAAARVYAENAAEASNSLAWAGLATLEFRCQDGDWPGALGALQRNREGGLVDDGTYRRQRAVLLTARALALGDNERTLATELAVEATSLSPGLVPAAALAGRLLAEAGERRQAGRILETAWRETPHPDLAKAYADLVPGTSARERLARMRALARFAEMHPESALSVATVALEAREFAEARGTLLPLLGAPTRRVATLMAQIEESERGDIGRAREWMARGLHAAHDPAWIADGFVSKTWMPVSPVAGRLDAFEWRVPLSELPRSGGVLIDDADRVAPLSMKPAPAVINASAELVSEASVAAPSASVSAARPDVTRWPVSEPIVETVLARAPDDPGPEPELPDAVLIVNPKPELTAGLPTWIVRGEENRSSKAPGGSNSTSSGQ